MIFRPAGQKAKYCCPRLESDRCGGAGWQTTRNRSAGHHVGDELGGIGPLKCHVRQSARVIQRSIRLSGAGPWPASASAPFDRRRQHDHAGLEGAWALSLTFQAVTDRLTLSREMNTLGLRPPVRRGKIVLTPKVVIDRSRFPNAVHEYAQFAEDLEDATPSRIQLFGNFSNNLNRSGSKISAPKQKPSRRSGSTIDAAKLGNSSLAALHMQSPQ